MMDWETIVLCYLNDVNDLLLTSIYDHSILENGMTDGMLDVVSMAITGFVGFGPRYVKFFSFMRLVDTILRRQWMDLLLVMDQYRVSRFVFLPFVQPYNVTFDHIMWMLEHKVGIMGNDEHVALLKRIREIQWVYECGAWDMWGEQDKSKILFEPWGKSRVVHIFE